MAAKRQRRGKGISEARLEEMIEEAAVDAYGESEQTVGFYTMLEDNLSVPFETGMLGVKVTVCSRGKQRQRIPVLDLPLPSPVPEGAERIEAFRRRARGR
jgi:hypothetical protein